MKKYWFKHHGKASADPRMRMLKEAFGYAGIGVYWEIVERIETWGDGQYPRKELVAVLRNHRVSGKMLNSILDDFFLFEKNEYDDVVLSSILVGECDDSMLVELQKERQREKAKEEERRKIFEMRQQWLPLDEDFLGETAGENHVTPEKSEEETPLTLEKSGELETAQGAHDKEEIREEKNKIIDDESWMKYVEPLKQEQTGWQDVVCMKSGYGTLLRRRWQKAIEEFVRHVIEHDQGHTIHTTHDARYYFASFARLSVKSGVKLRDTLQQIEDEEARMRSEGDPYRYELNIDGVRYAAGRPIPNEAPPRPTSTAVWNDATGEWGEAI